MRALIVLVLFIFSGCGERLMHGVIISKRSESGRTWVQPTHVGKTVIMIPHYDDPDWYVTIQGRSKSGELIETEHSVSESDFDGMQVGEFVNFE